MAEEIVNRVANSILEVFDLEDYYQEGKRNTIDIKAVSYTHLTLPTSELV